MEIAASTKELFKKNRFAFVEYPRLKDAEIAMEKLEGHKLDGLRLAVQWSKRSLKIIKELKENTVKKKDKEK